MSEPQRKLPKDWTASRICLKVTGGVGDALIAIGGSARKLAEKPCEVFGAVMEHQRPLIDEVFGVTATLPVTKLNSPVVRSNFDVLISFDGVFANGKTIKARDYYSLVGNHIGLQELGPGKFDFERELPDTPAVALHPGASNPNRRWGDEKWRRLAWELRDRKFQVMWLGTKDEFGFNGNWIRKVSDVDDRLTFQAKVLAHCNYFIGNDSSFAHVAGMLGVPGRVMFGATHPDNVICRYSSLKGIHCFEKLGVAPTQSLKVDDPTSLKALEAITVEQVLDSMNISAHECTPVDREESEPMRVPIAVIGICHQTDALAQFLAQYYDVETLGNMPNDETQYDIIIEVREEKCRIRTKKNEGLVTLHNFESVRRAIRELSGRTDNE
jgi:hypothetical protein